MSEQETIQSIASTVARIDERTFHMANRIDKINGTIESHDEELDGHALQINSLTLKQKIYLALSGIGVVGAACHDKIGLMLLSLLGL